MDGNKNNAHGARPVPISEEPEPGPHQCLPPLPAPQMQRGQQVVQTEGRPESRSDAIRLKPCRICGKGAFLRRRNGCGLAVVTCENQCGAAASFTMDVAVMIWNRGNNDG